MKKFIDMSNSYVAIAPSATVAALTGIAINATGYGRAQFTFLVAGGAATSGSFAASIWQNTSSGANWVSIAGASLTQLVSSAVISSGNVIATIDLPTSSAMPWLSVSATVANSTLQVAAMVDLYDAPSHVLATAMTAIVVL